MKTRIYAAPAVKGLSLWQIVSDNYSMNITRHVSDPPDHKRRYIVLHSLNSLTPRMVLLSQLTLCSKVTWSLRIKSIILVSNST